MPQAADEVVADYRRFGEDSIEMLCGKSFPVRQRDKKRLFAAFTQYQFRRMRKEV